MSADRPWLDYSADPEFGSIRRLLLRAILLQLAASFSPKPVIILFPSRVGSSAKAVQEQGARIASVLRNTTHGVTTSR